MNRSRNKTIILTVILLGLFLPVFNAHAGVFDLGDLTMFFVEKMFVLTLSFAFSLLGKILAFVVLTLSWAVNLRIYADIPVIESSWKIMRNFANMLFIIALIVMAYGTIFNRQGYDFRSLIPRFIIIAVLINFSLVISGLIIDVVQILNNTFLTAMGDIAGRLGQGLSPAQLLPSGTKLTTLGSANTIANMFSGSAITLVFSIFLLFTFTISAAVPMAVAVVRIPILWALIIVSPLAWLLSILPATKGAYEKWWHHFIGWNLFLPYYLFFMYFALFFLSKKNEVLAGLGQDFINSPHLANILDLQTNFTFGLLFYYILVAIFLIGGTKAAMNAARFSGTGIVNIAQGTRAKAITALRRTPLPYLGSYEAAERAAKQKLAQVQEEGLSGRFGKLYGGQYGLEQQTGRWAERFGVRGADVKRQRAFVEMAGKNYQDFERQYQNGQIDEVEVVKRAGQYNATDPRGYAYRKLAAKIGQMEAPLFTQTLQQLSDNPLAAEDFTKTSAEAKFSKMKGKDLAKMAAAEGEYSSLQNNIAARREMFRYVMTDKKASAKLTDNQIHEGIKIFGGHTTAAAKSFIKEVGKINPEYVVKYKLDTGLSRDEDLLSSEKEGFNGAYGRMPDTDPVTGELTPQGRFELKTHMFGAYLRSGDIKDLASIKKSTFAIPEFQEALKTYISQTRKGKPRRDFIQRLERTLLDTPEGDQKLEMMIGRGSPSDADYLAPQILGPGFEMADRRAIAPPTSSTGLLMR